MSEPKRADRKLSTPNVGIASRLVIQPANDANLPPAPQLLSPGVVQNQLTCLPVVSPYTFGVPTGFSFFNTTGPCYFPSHFASVHYPLQYLPQYGLDNRHMPADHGAQFPLGNLERLSSKCLVPNGLDAAVNRSRVQIPQFVTAVRNGHHGLAGLETVRTTRPATPVSVVGSSSGSIQPAFIFDDQDSDLPQDLSLTGIRETTKNVSGSPLPQSVLPDPDVDSSNTALESSLAGTGNSLMEMMSAAWGSLVPVDENDGWNFVQQYKQERRVQDFLHVHMRSFLTQLPAKYRDLVFDGNVELIAEELLSLWRLTPDKSDDMVTETPQEAPDVDPGELGQFVENLISGKGGDSGTMDEEKRLRMFSAVGLCSVSDAPDIATVAQTNTRRPRKKRKTEEGLPPVPVNEPSPARKKLRREIRKASRLLATKIADLQELLNSVEEIGTKEKQSLEQDLPIFLSDLKRIVGHLANK